MKIIKMLCILFTMLLASCGSNMGYFNPNYTEIKQETKIAYIPLQEVKDAEKNQSKLGSILFGDDDSLTKAVDEKQLFNDTYSKLLADRYINYQWAIISHEVATKKILEESAKHDFQKQEKDSASVTIKSLEILKKNSYSYAITFDNCIFYEKKSSGTEGKFKSVRYAKIDLHVWDVLNGELLYYNRIKGPETSGSIPSSTVLLNLINASKLYLDPLFLEKKKSE